MAAPPETEGFFDLVVVGAGLVGSAAARHAAEAGRRVCLVGPGEPAQLKSRVYGCHADEGRICRRLDVDPIWAILAARSMDRYADIEKRSGIRFHDACGCLAVGRAGGPYLAGVAATAEARGLALEALDEAALEARFPRLRLDASLLGDAAVAPGEAGRDPFRDGASSPTYAGLYEPATTRVAAGRVDAAAATRSVWGERAGPRTGQFPRAGRYRAGDDRRRDRLAAAIGRGAARSLPQRGGPARRRRRGGDRGGRRRARDA